MNLKDLCVEYDAANDEVDTARAVLEAALVKRSDVVKLIAGEVAPKKKFIRTGKEITIVNRNERWFFRGAKDEEGLVTVE